MILQLSDVEVRKIQQAYPDARIVQRQDGVSVKGVPRDKIDALLGVAEMAEEKQVVEPKPAQDAEQSITRGILGLVGGVLEPAMQRLEALKAEIAEKEAESDRKYEARRKQLLDDVQAVNDELRAAVHGCLEAIEKESERNRIEQQAAQDKIADLDRSVKAAVAKLEGFVRHVSQYKE